MHDSPLAATVFAERGIRRLAEVWNQRLEAALAGVEDVPQPRQLNDLHCQQVLNGSFGDKTQFQKLPTRAAAANVVAAAGFGSIAEPAP